MNRVSDTGKTLIEIVSAVGVIASLIFVGVEIRQSAAATRAATVLDLKNGWLQLNLTQIQNPEVGEAYRLVVRDGWDDVDYRTRFLVTASYRAIAHNWSNAYFQYRVGTIDDEQWQPIIRDIERESRAGHIWSFWEEWNHIYDDPFRSLIEDLRAANPSESS